MTWPVLGEWVRLNPDAVGPGNGQADPADANLALVGRVVEVDTVTADGPWCAVEWTGCGPDWHEYHWADLVPAGLSVSEWMAVGAVSLMAGLALALGVAAALSAPG